MPKAPTPTDPTELVSRVAPRISTTVLGFDVDGVLAPIVDHADDAVLQDGVWDSLAHLAQHGAVAVVSGRSLESLERLFGFHEAIHVIGSHGLEARGDDDLTLSKAEQRTLEQLHLLANSAIDAIGEGAWLEYKVASVVVHTRQANPATSVPAIGALRRLATMVEGATVKPGSEVIELLARGGNKGSALVALARSLKRQAGFFIGDDVTDEDAFAAVSQLADGVTVRVGPGPTSASYRLADDAAAADFVNRLAASIE